MSEAKGVHLFSNGMEFEAWRYSNCARCVTEPTCDLYNAIFNDSIVEGLYAGAVTQQTADRLGWVPEYRGVLDWPCAERQPGVPGEDPQPDPAAVEMQKAGAACLPGFEAPR